LNHLDKISNDPTAAERKQDHIQLAFQSQVDVNQIDKRFSYEPLLSAFPPNEHFPFSFLGKQIQAPIWVSSMTGGTEKAYKINHNLAKACAHFKMGMGLGSCRSLLESNERLHDFDFRKIIGDDLPFYANIGIAQLEILINENKLFLIDNLVDKLSADGIIIHINPLQEWLQPEGDKINEMPILTIKKYLDKTKLHVIVKEVGQGMGKESLRELVQLPIKAIEFAAHGGTNFSKLELLRTSESNQQIFNNISQIGHSAEEMVSFINELIDELGDKFVVQQFIASGGIKNFLDGYYVTQKLNAKTTIYGQASTLLKYAEQGYDELHQYIENQIKGLQIAKAYFRVK
jgi:isopentenyl-diphosphate delta-isomerase